MHLFFRLLLQSSKFTFASVASMQCEQNAKICFIDYGFHVIYFDVISATGFTNCTNSRTTTRFACVETVGANFRCSTRIRFFFFRSLFCWSLNANNAATQPLLFFSSDLDFFHRVFFRAAWVCCLPMQNLFLLNKSWFRYFVNLWKKKQFEFCWNRIQCGWHFKSARSTSFGLQSFFSVWLL